MVVRYAVQGVLKAGLTQREAALHFWISRRTVGRNRREPAFVEAGDGVGLRSVTPGLN